MTRVSVTHATIARAVTGGLVALTLLLTPAQAFAWGNGPGKSGNAFGTHDWIFVEANRMAATQGATWVNASIAIPATDDPDTKLRDFVQHNYDRWGKKEGAADKRVTTYYNLAVAHLAAGRIDEASYAVGLMSHYLNDVSSPLHTDNASAEKRMHSKYDKAIDARLNMVGKNSSWVAYDGYNHVNDPAALTASAARSAHASYSTLVGQYNRRGYNNKTVRLVTSRSINRATNNLADMIVSIQEDAALAWTSPYDVNAHQGLTTDGSANSDYWIFHTGYIQRYNSDWVSLDTTSTPFDGLSGFTEEKHLGTGGYHDGKLYVPAENWPSVTNQHILVFDAMTLDRLESKPTSQTHEVAAATVVSTEGTAGVLYVASFNDSSKLFKYKLDDLSYLGTMPLYPVPAIGIQGLAYRDGTFFIGTGRQQNLGRIYTADVAGNTRLIYTSTLPGWHEGIAWRNNLLLWLVDRTSTGNSRVRYFRLPGF